MRIDMTTREWHELIKPVLPHVSADKEMPGLQVVRIEPTEQALYAVATDRYTLAAERHWLGDQRAWDVPPVHIRATDAKASLSLFPFSKDTDPMLQIVIDHVPVRTQMAGRPLTMEQLAITIQAEDGTRLALHDHRDPTADPLAGWRKTLRSALDRILPDAAPAMSLSASQFARWAAAVRGAERLAMFTGSKEAELILVIVEQHFAAVWKPISYLEGPLKMLAEAPWLDELDAQFDLATASGLQQPAGAQRPASRSTTVSWTRSTISSTRAVP